MNNLKKIKLPLIVTDMDGVIIHNVYPLPKVKDTLKLLQKPLGEINNIQFGGDQYKDLNIPFCALTNRSAATPEFMANKMMETYGEFVLKKEQFILASSPLDDKMQEYKDKTTLIIGRFYQPQNEKRLHDYLHSNGITQFITGQEFTELYPYLVPLYNRCQNKEELQEQTTQKISKRLNITPQEIQENIIQIHAIFILNRPDLWEENLQIIMDILSTKDGKIAQKMPQKDPNEEHIPVYSTYNDLTYKADFGLPRMLMQPFNESLKMLYKSLYKSEMKLQLFGKPQISQFQFTENYAKQNFCKEQIEISQRYMIGDNPESDIQGANNSGWKSILVKTGVFQGPENDLFYPANYIVDDFQQAIQLIFDLEKIQYKF